MFLAEAFMVVQCITNSLSFLSDADVTEWFTLLFTIDCVFEVCRSL